MGRTAFRGDIINHHNILVGKRAIEVFNSEDIQITQGNEKGSVVVNEAITIINTMDKLYMTVKVN